MNKFLYNVFLPLCLLTPLQLPAAETQTANNAAPVAGENANGIGYATPQAALEALRTRKDVDFAVQNKWLVIRDTPNQAIWSFAPPDHPAYPAVIKRALVNKDGREQMATSALCRAKRAACDKMMAEVRATDDKMKESLTKSPASVASPEAVPTPAAPAAPTVIPKQN